MRLFFNVATFVDIVPCKNESNIDKRVFSIALPDPPMDVRVEGGPQDSTILVNMNQLLGQISLQMIYDI